MILVGLPATTLALRMGSQVAPAYDSLLSMRLAGKA